MGVRSSMLELAILGELEKPRHGYALRKRLSRSLGPVRRLSYGSLYPALHRLADKGLIKVVDNPEADTKTSPKRAGTKKRQVIYRTTAAGRKYLETALAHADTDDESMNLTVGLLSKASPATRLALLMDRRAKVLARHEAGQKAKRSSDFWVRSKGELDSAQALNELSWIDRLIQMDLGQGQEPIHI